MARYGRRLTIGGSGATLSDDDSLAQTGARGEVRRYVPPSPEEVAAGTPPVTAPPPVDQTVPTIILPEQPSGGEGAAPGSESGQGVGGPAGGPGVGEGGPSASDTGEGAFAHGGKVGGPAGEHPISAQRGEFVMSKDAVNRYGLAFMHHVNRGTAKIQRGKR